MLHREGTIIVEPIGLGSVVDATAFIRDVVRFSGRGSSLMHEFSSMLVHLPLVPA